MFLKATKYDTQKLSNTSNQVELKTCTITGKEKTALDMAKKYIHVNQHKIKANLKHATNEPVITIKEGKTNTYCHAVKIKGDSIVRYGEDGKPILGCGARVVIETHADIEIIK